ncbi:phosphopentomutase [Faecalibaculum rodentium]|uniref:phosphopentomutase n=1 Tax=Faecalibaculum rodentium TaxID=1702221 RepID=UPI002730EDB2|nr:phosphopentomutase [Faecalibaculum rodentium]
MTGRFVVIVLDGFGMQAMQDAARVRPGDERSSTLGSLLKDFPDLTLPNLESLGLMNAFGQESRCMKFSPEACFGRSELMHFGADTFQGHQEIMGTKPKKPETHNFQQKIDEIEQALLQKGHQVKRCGTPGLQYLLVDESCTVADNIDSDLGMAYNCTAPLDVLPFDRLMEIARIVRSHAQVGRVIAFGGTGNTVQDILAAGQTREGKYIGLLASLTKSYDQGYECRHLGYGVDPQVQVPSILAQAGVDVTLLGKVADIVHNERGKSVSCVDTASVLDLTIQELDSMKSGFICTNVQETDLAGHSQDPARYREVLETADRKIGELCGHLRNDDILVVMADHGNDPDIGHNRHTRENVPLLIRSRAKGRNVGLRKTLSDVGATVCDFFNAPAPENGTSFLKEIQPDS